ncbi:dipeptidyl aminopeptidase BII [Flavobacteriaceae bacterium UJ101]|nr:dipeptidyl aminopeptidase BII [Flavobacteriaceae bacterium UJ101]
MKKIVLAFSFLFSSMFVWADEGMWLLMLIERLNYQDMKEKGLQLTPEEIYSVNNSSLKDAIVHFNQGCTAEIISKEGLVLTNHHCGYEAIAELSTPEHDYLKDGFWAYKKDEELKPKDLNVRFLDRMEDMTNRIQSKLDGSMTQEKRQEIIEAEKKAIEEEYSENGKYIVETKSFFKGNEFYMFRYIQYDDVRLVGAPPSSIGKYGGDTDNWEWPRHTGDFSIFRVYGDKDGNPAAYSKDNVPLKPKHHLPISLEGIEPGDFAMILGFPGVTNRYKTSQGIEESINDEFPAWIDASKSAMDGMKKHMDADPAIKIAYASKYSRLANYWKNRIGMIESLEKNNTVANKQKIEKDLQKWIKKKKKRRAEYEQIFPLLDKYYASSGDYYRPFYHSMMVLRGSDLATMPFTLGEVFEEYGMLSEEERATSFDKFAKKIDEKYETIYPEVEKDIIASVLSTYMDKVPAKLQSSYIKELSQKYNGDFSKFTDDLEKTSIFFDKEKIKEALKTGNLVSLGSDPLLQFTQNIVKDYRASFEKTKENEEVLAKAERLYTKALRESQVDKVFYPDANSTMRLTYGTVRTLPRRADRPNDASENYYTTLKGAMAKYKKGDLEFDLPEKLIDLYNKKDYGQYAAPEGYLPVCFLTDNDITGGNSGSPVINGKGALIGSAFDGNSEALSGDILFEDNLQRTIIVDIRYVLFIIDKYAGAQNLIDEMTIVK